MLPILAALFLCQAPADPVAAAVLDLNETVENIDPARKAQARYLSLWHIPTQEEREATFKALSFLINSVSRKPDIARPAKVVGTDGRLVRLFLDDYDIKPEAWDNFALKGNNQSPEPYFRVVPKAFAEATGSQRPILRADWFFHHASAAPSYYDLLGLGTTVEQFHAFVGYDERKSKRAGRVPVAAIVTGSAVARNNRYFQRTPLVQGYMWAVYDTQASTGTKEYLRSLLSYQYDEAQYLASLPNGLQVYFIATGRGQRLVASSPTITVHDRDYVRAGVSCMACHVRGVRQFEDDVRRLLKDKKPTDLLASRQDIQRMADLFGGDLDFAKDQEAFVKSAKAATGAESVEELEAVLGGLSDLRAKYAKPVTRAAAVLELGVSDDDFDDFCRATKIPALANFAEFERPIPRKVWEELYSKIKEKQ